MASQLSPGIIVQERDFTNARLQEQVTNIGAIAGPFIKGEVGVAKQITSEKELVETYGKPTNDNFEWWFTASEFLNYGGNLYVARISDSSANYLTNANSTGSVASGATGIKINNVAAYEANVENTSPSYKWVAKTPGTWGNAVQVAVIDRGADQLLTVPSGLATSTVGTVVSGSASGAVGKIFSYDSTTKQVAIVLDSGKFTTSDSIQGAGVSVATNWYDEQYAVGNTIKWNSIAGRPGTSAFVSDKGGAYDEMHVIVYDGDGSLTGTSGTILEKILFASKASDAKTLEGENNFYKNIIKGRSSYVYLGAHESTYQFTPANAVSISDTGKSTSTYKLLGNLNYKFGAGTDYQNYNVGNETQTYLDVFSDTESLNIDYILSGPTTASKASSLIALATNRKDSIVFISPRRSDVLGSGAATASAQTLNVVEFFESISDSSSYAVFDNNYKYLYDRFNDTYRWIPCNADVAGLIVNTANSAEPWYSPAGFNRGNLRSAIKVAYNPNKAQRDELYGKRVNPISSFPGQGIVLFGDKTALRSPSAFDRVNVRKLFLVIERTVKQFSQNVLFELNDEATRANFTAQVEAYLRDVQSRRGIVDFAVVADSSNNTAEVIDRNEFVGDIYIKPTRSINYITLTFVATRSNVTFDEVIGRV